jgi:Flp pilus assembly protein CpaB
MTYRARSIVIAAFLVVMASMLVTLYVTNYKRSVEHSQEHVGVYVAAKEIPAGTTGEDIASKGYLSTQQVLKQSVVPGAITDPKKQLAGLVAAQEVYPGEQITVNSFSSVALHGLRGFLRGTLRAVQIAGDPNQVLAGTLQTGDHVDLVANIKLGQAQGLYVDRIVLRNLKVLRAPTAAETTSKLSGPNGATVPVMLAVTDTQVQKLFAAVKNEDWTLELRPVVKAADSSEVVQTKRTLIEDGLRPNELRVAHEQANHGGAR